MKPRLYARVVPLKRCAGLLLFAAACGSPPANNGGLQSVDRGACGDFELDVERFWSSKTRAEVDAGITKISGERSAQVSERIVTKMDELTRDWVMMQEGICKDTLVRKVMPEEAYVKVSLCLAAR